MRRGIETLTAPLVAGVVLLLAAPASAPAGTSAGAASPPAESVEKLHRLRQEIRDLERKARRAGDRQRSLVEELQRLDRLAALHREELTVLTARTEDVMDKVRTSDTRLEALAAEREEKVAHLMERVSELRRFGRIGYAGALLARPREEGFLTALRHLSRLIQRDRRRMNELRSRTEELHRIRADLERTNRELERLRDEARISERSRRLARAEKTRLMDSLRKERNQALRLKEELEEAARDLQLMVGGLATGPAEGVHVPLRLYRGELTWPVDGKVTQEFGRVGDTRFDIPYPGIDIWAPSGTPVKAVAAGTVVYADWFHGYGKTVCLDHGDGYITVYAHAEAILVERGQRVGRGDVVARVGDTGSLEGPHLYFQISKDGEPLDPREWLAG